MYPSLELCPGGGWFTSQIGGVSGIPNDSVIPETGEALQVNVYDGGIGPGTAGLDVMATSGVPARLEGSGDEAGDAGVTAA